MDNPSRLQGGRLTQTRAFLLWVFLGAYAFDFKGPQEGGSAVQYALCLVNMAACLLLLLTDPTALRYRGRKLDNLAVYWFSFLAATFATFVTYKVFQVSDLTLYKYSRLVVPYLGCGFSILVVRSLQATGAHPRELTTPLLVTAVASMAWRFFYATQVTGIPMSEMRFQTLSLAAPYLLSVGCINVLLGRKVDLFRILSFVMTVVLIVLSITRTYLIVLGVSSSACLYLIYRGRRSPSVSLATRAYTLGSLAALLALGLGVQAALRPDAFEAWVVRMTNNAGGRTKRDTTMMTREAEAFGMWAAIKDDPLFLLFGKGFGASYAWDPSYFDELEKVSKMDEEQLEPWQTSHSLWTYPIFACGLVFGPMVYGLVLVPLYRGGRAAEAQSMFRDPRDQEAVAFPFVTLAAYTSLCFFSNPFIDRYGGFLLGIFAAAAFWSEDLALSAKGRSNRAGRSPPPAGAGAGWPPGAGPGRARRPAPGL